METTPQNLTRDREQENLVRATRKAKLNETLVSWFQNYGFTEIPPQMFLSHLQTAFGETSSPRYAFLSTFMRWANAVKGVRVSSRGKTRLERKYRLRAFPDSLRPSPEAPVEPSQPSQHLDTLAEEYVTQAQSGPLEGASTPMQGTLMTSVIRSTVDAVRETKKRDAAKQLVNARSQQFRPSPEPDTSIQVVDNQAPEIDPGEKPKKTSGKRNIHFKTKCQALVSWYRKVEGKKKEISGQELLALLLKHKVCASKKDPRGAVRGAFLRWARTVGGIEIQFSKKSRHTNMIPFYTLSKVPTWVAQGWSIQIAKGCVFEGSNPACELLTLPAQQIEEASVALELEPILTTWLEEPSVTETVPEVVEEVSKPTPWVTLSSSDRLLKREAQLSPVILEQERFVNPGTDLRDTLGVPFGQKISIDQKALVYDVEELMIMGQILGIQNFLGTDGAAVALNTLGKTNRGQGWTPDSVSAILKLTEDTFDTEGQSALINLAKGQ